MKKLLGWLTNFEPRHNQRPASCAKQGRRGVSLVEVLIGAFILAIGLAGLAGLVEVGRYSVIETYKADRSAACGRAVLHDIKTRGIVARAALTSNSNMPLLIDPIGVANGVPTPAGLTPITPQHTASMWERWQDDISKPDPKLASEQYVRSNPPQARGQYSWIVTINPSVGEDAVKRRSFEASVAVCFARANLAVDSKNGTVEGRGIAGGRITINSGYIQVKENQWILLTGGTTTERVARWYRVVAANAEDMGNGQIGTKMLNVIGPDWDTTALGATVTIHVFENVCAVYTETMSIPDDPAWNRFEANNVAGNP